MFRAVLQHLALSGAALLMAAGPAVAQVAATPGAAPASEAGPPKVIRYAFQVVTVAKKRSVVCSEACKTVLMTPKAMA